MTKPIDLDRILELAKETHDRPWYNRKTIELDPTTITALAEELKEYRRFVKSLVDPYFDLKVSERMMPSLKEHSVSLKAREHMKKWGL